MRVFFFMAAFGASKAGRLVTLPFSRYTDAPSLAPGPLAL